MSTIPSSYEEWIANAKQSPTINYVLQFAAEMEAKLEKNRHKGDRAGWLSCDPWDLLILLRNEVVELELAMEHCLDAEEVTKEAADIANFALMVADSYRNRKLTKS